VNDRPQTHDYDALLDGLADSRGLPDDDAVREYVIGLAQATDQENQYEQSVLEHRAFAELIRALGGSGEAGPGASADWGGLLAAVLHQTQFQIIEAMGWIGEPISASQLVEVFERDREDLSMVSYHLRRLHGLGVARLCEVRKVRGAKERLYGLIAVGS
jgi:hypothetical protein